MRTLSNGDFLWLRKRPGQTPVWWDAIGLMVSDEHVRHLYCDGATGPEFYTNGDARDHVDSSVRSYTYPPGGLELIHIHKDHPLYDQFWAWFCALELGAEVRPPVDNEELLL